MTTTEQRRNWEIAQVVDDVILLMQIGYPATEARRRMSAALVPFEVQGRVVRGEAVTRHRVVA